MQREEDGHDNVKVVQTIHSVPQNGWLDPPNHIKIDRLTILVQDGTGKWVPWSSPVPENKSHDKAMLVMQ